MEKKLQMIEEDMQKLSKMNQTLFAAWQDKLSDHFSKGCLGEMERQWKQYVETLNPLLRQLQKSEDEMTEYRDSCKKR